MIALEFSGRPPDHRILLAGYDAEKQLAFYLDRAFRDQAFIRIFHGLRVTRGEDVAQIDHLVLHRFGFVLVESKSIVEAVNINEHGEFTRIYRCRREGMPSPIKQAKRQQALLQELLDDHKASLRRVVGIGPIKRQAEFYEKRFSIIAAISDKGQITCEGERPEELMKAEAVVETIQKKIDYQRSLASMSGLARSFLDEYTNRRRAKEWEENHLRPFIDEEVDKVTEFLLQRHTPRSKNSAPHGDERVNVKAATIGSPRRQSVGAEAPSDSVTNVPKAKPSQSVGPQLSRKMAKWTPEEEGKLRQRFSAGAKPKELASEFGRTAWALRLRAQKIGLISDVKEWR